MPPPNFLDDGFIQHRSWVKKPYQFRIYSPVIKSWVMTLEKYNEERLTLQEEVPVLYGGAESVGIGESIRTVGLFSCVGVVLMDNETVAVAHFPLPALFSFYELNEYGEVTRKGTRTFEELVDELFSKFGSVSGDIRAYVIGGVEGISSFLIDKIVEAVGDRDVYSVETKGPHSRKEEWDVRVEKGKVKVNSRKRHKLSYVEGST
jgi:chemotaxis receptor (MCP) glutamine deamidase CheD